MEKCIAFEMEDAKKALNHIKENWEEIEEYDNHKYGHPLYVWDSGCRVLGRCKSCNKLILYQCSEFHGQDGNDSYYDDYFPVSSAEEAEELNKKYDGFEIESNLDKKWLCITNSDCCWKNK